MRLTDADLSLSDAPDHGPSLRDSGTGVSWPFAIAALAAVLGSLVSIWLYVAIGGSQQRVADLHFSNAASDELQSINFELKNATAPLYSMRAYFDSLAQRPDRSEYHAFSVSLRDQVVGLRDCAWAPLVTAAERDAFEHEVRASGLPDFQIVERDAAGRLVRAADRPEYFPVLYADPGVANREVLGFDVASETARRGAIARARATDRPAATPSLTLVNLLRPVDGMLSFMPVKAEEKTAIKGARPIGGMIQGVIETAAMLDNILATRVRPLGLDVYVFDPNGDSGKRLIYWHGADGSQPPAEAGLLAGLHWQGSMDLLDQHWTAIFVPSTAYDRGVSGWMPILVLLTGLAITGSIVFYFLFSHHRTKQLETLTRSLRETTAQLRQNGARLDHMARHDELTGLPNRGAFRADLARGLHRVGRGQELALLYLDLDRFKAVNDTLGHSTGDLLLRAVADRLRSTVRRGDLIARLGGDEFAIGQCGPDQPRSAEALAQRLIDTLSRPYEVGGHRLVVGVSVGIAVAELDEPDVDQLLRRADMALYAAKRDGRGTSRCFDPVMDLEAQARRGLEMDLRHALENGGLEVHYQPQVGIADGRVRGFEALVRWRHPERGMVMPSDFIRCAEETGLIVPMGDLVLRTALAQAAEWPDEIRVSVNLSPYQLARADLADTIEAMLAASGQAAGRLELEITETALLEQYASGQATLRRLRDLGVQIAMDDFGTGYASLSHLRSFPFDRLKIDHSFVSQMTESVQGDAIVTAILQLAASLAIACTAEGVETHEQLEQLAAAGCAEAQGFLFSRARPASEIAAFLAAWQPSRVRAFGAAEQRGARSYH